MNQNQILTIVEQYSRQSTTTDADVKVTRVPDYKTVFIEQTGSNGRSIIMSPYKVDGKTFWAGYSSPSETIYISHAG